MEKTEECCCSYDEEVIMMSVGGGGMKKFCADCKTTKTPLWRGGPNGPKTLCNACGIRYRKKRDSSSSSSCTVERKRERAESVGDLRTKLVALGEEVLLHSVQKQQKKIYNNKKLGEEEEQAAFCLMALSSGFLFA